MHFSGIRGPGFIATYTPASFWPETPGDHLALAKEN